MSGDYSRWTFDPANDHAAVLLQQGRILTDADWNENASIGMRRQQATTLDVVGAGGVPSQTPDGFEIALPAAGQLTIGVGRAYVDGLLAENHGAPRPDFDPTLAEAVTAAPVAYTQQPYYPAPPALPVSGTAVAYLKVWQRDITALERPALIEPALGIDTTTRLQTAWQVKVLPVAGLTDCPADLTALPGFLAAEPPAAARLTVSTVTLGADPDPCLIAPAEGYTGLENQLYRVQVHTPGKAGTATFTWSRDNATVAARVLEIPAARDRIVVDRLGPDEVLSFHDGDWIEITDDRRELHGLPGELRRIVAGGGVDEATRTLLLTKPLPAGAFSTDAQGHTDAAHNVRVRRWDQAHRVLDSAGNLVVDLDAAAATGAIPVPGPATKVVLENGIAVAFSTDPAGGVFRTGDHWVIPARTVGAQVADLDEAPPMGVHAHYLPLAVLTLPTGVQDCRRVFPPLSELDSLVYVAGDGQEATPDPAAPAPVAVPIRPTVGVARGPLPVAGRKVRFSITGGSGTVDGAASAVVSTGVDGLASVAWLLDPATDTQTISAQLLDASGQPIALPVRFSARLRTAATVAYQPGACSVLSQQTTVQAALDALCAHLGGGGCCATVGKQGEYPDLPTAIKELSARFDGHVCVCLLPEVHEYAADPIEGLASLTVHGPGALVRCHTPLVVIKCHQVSISEVTFELPDAAKPPLLHAEGCGSVTLERIVAHAQTGATAALVRLGGCARLRVTGCELRPATLTLPGPGPRILGDAGRRLLEILATGNAARMAAALKRLREDGTLEAATGQLTGFAETGGRLLTRDERLVIARVVELTTDDAALRTAWPELRDRFKAVPEKAAVDTITVGGVGLLIADGHGATWLDGNRIEGGLALYGDVEVERFVAYDERQPELEKQATEHAAPVADGGSELHLADSSLAWVLSAGEPPFDGCFGTAAVHGTVVTDAPAVLAAGQATLAGVTLNGTVGRLAGIVFANAATATGLLGQSKGRVLLAAAERAQAGNAQVVLTP